MARITGKNTTPELHVRSLLHRLGYRFRLHRKNLPGKPDIVLPKWKTVIFVHGCFWHGHHCKRGSKKRRPKSNIAYWNSKIDSNIKRDTKHRRALANLGWKYIVIWNCELSAPERLEARICWALSDRIAEQRKESLRHEKRKRQD